MTRLPALKQGLDRSNLPPDNATFPTQLAARCPARSPQLYQGEPLPSHRGKRKESRAQMAEEGEVRALRAGSVYTDPHNFRGITLK